MAGGNGGNGTGGDLDPGGAGGAFGLPGGSTAASGGGGGAGAAGGNGNGSGGAAGESGTAQAPGGTAGGVGGLGTSGDGGGGGGNGILFTAGGVLATDATFGGGSGGSGTAGDEERGGGGGGEGGYGIAAPGASPATIEVEAGEISIAGGDGGSGGVSVSGNTGGRGGDGGVGVFLPTSGSSLDLSSGRIEGGNGGVGGTGLSASGSGGTGGAGVVATSATVQNGGTLQGGGGGLGGLVASSADDGVAGAGGAGVVGANLTIVNSGTIAGGRSGSPLQPQADAIDVTGGTNMLTLSAGGTQGTLDGALGVTGLLTIDPGITTSMQATLTNVIHDTADGAGRIGKGGAAALALSGQSTYSGGTTLNGGTLELGGATESATDIGPGLDTVTYGAAGTGDIAFGPGSNATLKVDDIALTSPGGTTSYLAYALTGFAAGDVIDLGNLGATGATVSYSGNDLTVTANGTSDRLDIDAAPTGYAYTTMTDASGAGIDVVLAAISAPAVTGTAATATTQDTPVTPSSDATLPVATGSGGAIPADTVSIASPVSYRDGVFTLTGTASSVVGVKSVEISAAVNGTRQDLGAAAVNANGTFTFIDAIGANLQGFFQAAETDDAGGTATSADPLFSLIGGLGPDYGSGRQTQYTASGEGFTADTRFGPDGTQSVSVKSQGQTFSSAYDDTFNNAKQADTSFVFTPGFSLDVVNGFKVGGDGHDMLSFKGADFGSTPQAQLGALLANAHNDGGSLSVDDPISGDAVQLKGITKAQLIHNERDITFHA